MRPGVPAVIAAAAAFAVVVGHAPHAAATSGSERWTPAPGQAFNGWAPLDRQQGATWQPCQQVDWFFDRTGEPSDRIGMIDDIRGGLASLQGPSGLRFAETASAGDADLTFSWGDLADRSADTAGIGGPSAIGRGEVTFSRSSPWTSDLAAGRGKKEIDRPDLGDGWYQEGDGRQTIVIHETMHAMGFDHVGDTASIMHPNASNGTTFSAGDLEGLRTMYSGNPCPVGQVCVKAGSSPQACEPGGTWAYEMCWGAARGAVLQRRVDGRWRTVKRGIARNDGCAGEPGYGWTVQFTRAEASSGRQQYRVLIPAQGGYRQGIDPITVEYS